MSKFLLKNFILLVLCFFVMVSYARAQVVVQISDTAKQQIFRYNKIDYFEDTHNSLDINQVKSPGFAIAGINPLRLVGAGGSNDAGLLLEHARRLV